MSDRPGASHVLVTGGAGFIGSHLVDRLLDEPETRVTVLDALTYAGSRDNLASHTDDERFALVVGNVNDESTVRGLVDAADVVVHAAAESHVDRSIEGPGSFVETNVLGTQVLLEACRQAGTPMLYVSTDEGYGSGLPDGSLFDEAAPLRPRSPYAASKAGGDLLCRAYAITYGANVSVVRGTNAYGRRQFPEKVIPTYTAAALASRPLPVYGDGSNRREWLHVADWVEGALTVLRRGEPGGVYNIGAGTEISNLELAERICDLTDAPRSLISFVEDRPGHDFRYGITSDRLRGLGWEPTVTFDDGLADTVAWYRERIAAQAV